VEILSKRKTSPNKAAQNRQQPTPNAVPHDHGEPNSLEEFRKFRERMNAEILGEGNVVINRFFALDTRTYEAGALDVKTKELLGLVASLVLRCDDSIVIPHLRRAVDRWSELERLAR